MKLVAIADYYRTQGARDLCHGIKDRDTCAVTQVSKSMATYAKALPQNSILIPIPSHTGHATTTLFLVEQISKHTGLPVADILIGRAREPLYVIKLKRQMPSADFFSFALKMQFAGGQIPILVDTVLDTGQTAQAAAKLFPNHQPGIFTYARVIKP